MLYYSQNANDTDAVRREISEIIAQGRTQFQSYMFLRSSVNGVCIVLDGDIQSCAVDEALYHEALTHPALLLHPAPRNVLIMGGGEGATSREVLRHRTVEKTVMVDIDREFVQLCKTHIPEWNAGAFDDPRHETRFEDIHAFLAETQMRFDVIIGDLVDFADDDSLAAAFYSPEFYERLRGCLAEGGLIATQAGPLSPATMAHHNRVRKGLREAFGEVRSFGGLVPSFYSLWGYVVAGAALEGRSASDMAEMIRRHGAERELALPATGLDTLANGAHLPAMLADMVE